MSTKLEEFKRAFAALKANARFDRSGDDRDILYGHNITYDQIIAAIGLRTECSCDDADYSGDTHSIVRGEDGRLGYLRFGWGSCSGCDALQGAEEEDDFLQIMVGLWESVEWFRDHGELLKFRETADWENRCMTETVEPWLTTFDAFLERLGAQS